MLNKEKLLLEWTSFPLSDYPKKTALLILFLVIFSAILWKVTIIEWEMPLFYVLSMIFLLLEISPYFVKTNYQFYENDIIIKYIVFSVKKKYSDYGCFYSDKTGIMLSPFAKPRRLDRFRGISIRFSKSKEEKEKLIELLKQKIGKKY